MTLIKSKFVTPFIVFLSILLIWEILVNVWNIPNYLLPNPTSIIHGLLYRLPFLLPHIQVTFIESFSGFVIGSLFGFILAVLFVFSSTLEKAIYPYAIALKSVPIVAIAPMLVIWFGNELLPKIIISAIISFFPVVVNVAKGLKSVENEALDLFNSLSANKTQIFLKLQIYNSIPFLFSALKISATLSVIGAIVGEFAGSDKGLGFFILISSRRLETVDMFIGIILASLMGIFYFYIISFLERTTSPWAKEYNLT